MENIAIELKNINLNIGNNFSMENLSLNLRKGYITGLIGRNGSGKTTLIKVISDTIERISGSVLYDGLNFWDNEVEVKRKISVVYDRPNFRLKVKPERLAFNISSFEENFNMGLFYNLMDRFELNPRNKVSTYSMGMQKKLMLIIAICRRPEILILDEPTSGVDPISRSDMMYLLQEFMEDESHSILFSTHITSDLDRVADYIVMIENGRIVIDEEKEELKNNYSKENGMLPEIESIMQKRINDGRNIA